MLNVSDIVSPDAQSAVMATGKTRYNALAHELIAENFPVFARILDDAAQDALIETAYEQSVARRFSKSADHLCFLTAMVFWGKGFASDYQFYDDLYDAGWLEQTHARPSLKRLAHRLDGYVSACAPDLGSRRRIMLGLLRIFRTPAAAPSADDLISVCAEVWPARTRRMRPELQMAWAQSALQQAAQLGLSGQDAIFHGVLALYFGHHLFDDPMLPWAGEAYPLVASSGVQSWREHMMHGVHLYFDDRVVVPKGQS